MAQLSTKDLTTLPVGRLGLIPLESCQSLGAKVNDWLVKWRQERNHQELNSFAFEGYQRDSYILGVQTPRFGSGEGKSVITESVRGDDIYLMVDVCNYSMTYRISGFTNLMSPDDHFQDLKRVIGAIGGKARRVNVIMPPVFRTQLLFTALKLFSHPISLSKLFSETKRVFILTMSILLSSALTREA